MIFCGHWHISLTADFKLPPNSGHGIIAAERLLYLRILVSAFTAESQALKSAGGTMAAERTLYLRIPVSAFTAESRALNSARRPVAAQRTWYNNCKAARPMPG